MNKSRGIDSLIHDVNSKCSGLKGAAAILRNISSREASELLELMAVQSESLAQDIAGFRRKQGAIK